jgi:hypothetical protein
MASLLHAWESKKPSPDRCFPIPSLFLLPRCLPRRADTTASSATVVCSRHSTTAYQTTSLALPWAPLSPRPLHATSRAQVGPHCPLHRRGDLTRVLPHGRSPWPELSGHPLLSLVGALGPVWCWDAHRGVRLGPATTAGEVRRHAPRWATMCADKLSPMALPFV